jgi:hypothetical protein
MQSPKKGTVKKTTKPTYTKKSEVASSTAVKDKLKDVRQDPKNKIQFATINGTVVKSVKDKTGKVVKRSYTKDNNKVTQKSNKNTLIKKVSKPALVSGEYTEKVDTSGYSKGKQNFPYEFSYPEVKKTNKTGKTERIKTTKDREYVKKNFILKKGGMIKTKKK